mmetsp:Transcript_59007/g.118467  ORF Transcript_59007/g.118467 Transcript_59007/m.118467 type:complete len:336 (-) Transcript_59007:1337-2344(-)
MKTSICIALLFAAGTQGVVQQLCNTEANYLPNAIAETQCRSTEWTAEEYNAAGFCPGGIQFEFGGTYYCQYDAPSSDSECAVMFPNNVYSFNEDSCDVKSDSLYTDLVDLEQQCTDSSTINELAEKCCSDHISVCNQFVSQLCAVEAAYDSTAVFSHTCFKVFDTEADYNAEACTGGGKTDTYDVTGDGVADFTCWIYEVTSEADCTSRFTNGFTGFSENKCASESDDWSYTGLTDLEAKCAASDTIAYKATKCCSDGVSVCNQFVSQLCETDANYLPSAIGSTDCFQVYATTAEFDAESCDGGRKYGVADGLDLDEDGVTDLICVYYTTNSQAV